MRLNLQSLNVKFDSLIGVLDGHGGREIVDFVGVCLPNRIKRELANKLICINPQYENLSSIEDLPMSSPTVYKEVSVEDGSKERENIGKFYEEDTASIEERLRRAFLITDIQSRKAGLTVSGATGIVCLIENEVDDLGTEVGEKSMERRIVGKNIYTANVGDSRAVLYHQQEVVRLSRDHKAENLEEIKRIENSGGFVIKNRTMGILAVSRSFGDHRLKELVTCEPYINTHHLQWEPEDLKGGTGDKSGSESFLIIACDGLWDVFTDKEACGMVNDFLRDISQKKQSKVSQEGDFEKNKSELDLEEDADDDNYNWRNPAGTITGTVEDYETVKASILYGNNPNNENERDGLDIDNEKTSELNGRKKICAKMLIEEAMRRGSTDNITCVVAFL